MDLQSEGRAKGSGVGEKTWYFLKMTSSILVSSTLFFLAFVGQTWAQNPTRKNIYAPKTTKTQCCDDVRALKVQLANLTSLLEELSRKQEADRVALVRQVLELEKQNQQQEARVTEAESKYSEINNRMEIMQLQAAQAAPHTTSGKGKPLLKGMDGLAESFGGRGDEDC